MKKYEKATVELKKTIKLKEET